MTVMSRDQFIAAVDAADRHPHGETQRVMRQLVECVATYRNVYYRIEQVMRCALEHSDDPQEQYELRRVLDELNRGQQ